MNKTVLIQTFRNFDVPRWVSLCQETVQRYAQSKGWVYSFLGDEFFDFAPDWAKQAVKGNNLCTISDLCRLEWIKQLLNSYDCVVWADIDILVINPSQIDLNLSFDEGFSYEVWFDETGAHDGINNAFMFFKQGSVVLEKYIQQTYSRLRSPGGVDRTALGPDLLRSLQIPEAQLIKGLNIINFAASARINNSENKQIPDYIAHRSKYPIAAANMCLNERSLFPLAEREKYDTLLLSVCRSLLKHNNLE
jgi:hypothetical protein